MNIKNIILDLGGVLLNIDYHLTIRAFKDLGIQNFEELYNQANQNNLFDDFETGHIEDFQFIEEIAREIPHSISKTLLIEAWNAMLLDFPQERLDYLLQLKEKYNTALLSNTNTIHLEYFHNQLKDEHGINSLDEYFDRTYFSCDMKMRKPHPEIFLAVCKNEGYNPSETLFIDDSIQHVEGAKKAGLHAFHLDVKSTHVIELLGTLLT